MTEDLTELPSLMGSGCILDQKTSEIGGNTKLFKDEDIIDIKCFTPSFLATYQFKTKVLKLFA